jgi:hypothetical protein
VGELGREKAQPGGDQRHLLPESVFFWLNKLFLAGYDKVLTLEALYPLDSSSDAKALHDKFSANID